MSVPAIIGVGSAIVIAANPAALVPVVALYTVNMAARVAYEQGTLEAARQSADALQEIADYLNHEGVGVATVLENKQMGVEEAHLHVNIVPPDEKDSYSESWSVYTPG
jgi:hypothetical protein